MSKINFIIISPEFRNNSGGILALHKLADILSTLGEQSYITVPTYPGSNAKPIDYPQLSNLDLNKTMFIYPEIIIGNPYNAKYVTRWLLNTPGVIGGDGVYDSNDLVYKFWNYFKAPDESKVSGELRCLDFKLDKFVNKNFPRYEECFLVKKGAYVNKPINQHSSQSLNLDNFVSDEYLSYVFNLKEKFISYDTMTIHSIQAALCGCLSIVIPDPGITKEYWVDTCPVNKYGVAYGLNDIQWAKDTLHLVRDHLLFLENDCINLIKNYVEKCYNHIK